MSKFGQPYPLHPSVVCVENAPRLEFRGNRAMRFTDLAYKILQQQLAKHANAIEPTYVIGATGRTSDGHDKVTH